MIPKIIHYSWISDDPYPPLIRRCMASWKKFAPDYEIVRWDRTRFNTDSLRFTREAMTHKKWAFVSDVQRLYALYEFGGIYLDSDVELVKPLDDLLHEKAFVGMECARTFSMGIIGSEKKHPWIKVLLDYYRERGFVQEDGSCDLRPNTDIVTALTEEAYGIRLTDNPDRFGDDVRVFPQRVFSPPIIFTGWAEKTAETIAIHHFTGTWKPREVRNKQNRRRYVRLMKYFLGMLLGSSLLNRILMIKRRISRTEMLR